MICVLPAWNRSPATKPSANHYSRNFVSYSRSFSIFCARKSAKEQYYLKLTIKHGRLLHLIHY